MILPFLVERNSLHMWNNQLKYLIPDPYLWCYNKQVAG